MIGLTLGSKKEEFVSVIAQYIESDKTAEAKDILMFAIKAGIEFNHEDKVQFGNAYGVAHQNFHREAEAWRWTRPLLKMAQESRYYSVVKHFDELISVVNVTIENRTKQSMSLFSMIAKEPQIRQLLSQPVSVPESDAATQTDSERSAKRQRL